MGLIEMKRFMLFAGDTYYACGGANDHQGSYDDLYEAIAAGQKELADGTVDWWHVYDKDEDVIADSSDSQAYYQ
jgi:hypothetical protein